jgi:hypothetical protein
MNAKFVAHNGLSDTTTAALTQTQVSELINAYMRNFFIKRDANNYSEIIDELALTGKSLCDPVALDQLLTVSFPARQKDPKGKRPFRKALDHLVTLAALISPRLQDGTSVLSYSDPKFQGGFVAFTTAARESFVINHDGSGVSIWSQGDLYPDPTLREGERVTVKGFPATVVFSEGDTVYARINGREDREDRDDREAREGREARENRQSLEALPRSQVVVSCGWASTTWPPNVVQASEGVETGEAVEADRRESSEPVSFYVGEPVVFRTSDETYTGVVSVLDTDRVVITGSKTGGDKGDPAPVYYVVARSAVERRDDEQEPCGSEDTVPSKRHKTCG